MTWYLVPLSGNPESFEIVLAGVNYTMTVKWNAADDAGWQFDLANADTGVVLLAGQPLVTGVDCLAGLDYLGIGGMFVVYTNGNDTAVPDFDNLGTQSNLYFLVTS